MPAFIKIWPDCCGQCRCHRHASSRSSVLGLREPSSGPASSRPSTASPGLRLHPPGDGQHGGGLQCPAAAAGGGRQRHPEPEQLLYGEHGGAVMSGRGYHSLFPVFTQADAECENTGGGRLEGALSRSMNSLSSLVSSFVTLPSTFPPFLTSCCPPFILIL